MRGQKLSSGSVAQLPELNRTERVSVCLRPGERADLGTIADAWNVATSTAAWAILATYLAECRSQAVNLGPDGIGIAASIILLNHIGLDDRDVRPEFRGSKFQKGKAT